MSAVSDVRQKSQRAATCDACDAGGDGGGQKARSARYTHERIYPLRIFYERRGHRYRGKMAVRRLFAA